MSAFNIAERAAHAVRDSYHVLRAANDLSPRNNHITHTLTHLVRTLQEGQAAGASVSLLLRADLEEARRHLPGLCGEAEGEMEKHWARKLVADKNPALEKFWYYAEYCALCHAETALLRGRVFDRVSFLGSGALPVTAFLLAREMGAGTSVTCVDFDAEACDLSEQLVARLGLQRHIDVRCMDALAYTPQGNELVLCASLLQGRQAVYRRVAEQGAALMVRDAEGAYRFLYNPCEKPGNAFREVAKTSPDPSRINTTRYYEQTA